MTSNKLTSTSMCGFIAQLVEHHTSVAEVTSSILARGTNIFVAPGEHSFSIFREENIPWSICVLLTRH